MECRVGATSDETEEEEDPDTPTPVSEAGRQRKRSERKEQNRQGLGPRVDHSVKKTDLPERPACFHSIPRDLVIRARS